ncbi:SHOCT domain-containing protein [Paenibacillus sp. RRE4]|uniref:SHOCT domain-containing protein n=1 Tax=Paenibacillus sp. RRE4 TaxID=2962587 RepID=UPI00288257AF|nr:SHOCT domain-containing protein [Paenibacillus sp. RRE4]MDT0122058.1 SHOCT domain-containing protein [Paenibacillus sp. RRE4]
MNMKRVMFVGTMIVTMSFAGTAWSKSAISPIPLASWSIVSINSKDDNKDELLSALNLSSEEDLYQDLYVGKSLKTIADENDGDFSQIVAYQVHQLSQQLKDRLAKGSITQEQYEAQHAELEQIVLESASTSYEWA